MASVNAVKYLRFVDLYCISTCHVTVYQLCIHIEYLKVFYLPMYFIFLLASYVLHTSLSIVSMYYPFENEKENRQMPLIKQWTLRLLVQS